MDQIYIISFINLEKIFIEIYKHIFKADQSSTSNKQLISVTTYMFTVIQFNAFVFLLQS